MGLTQHVGGGHVMRLTGYKEKGSRGSCRVGDVRISRSPVKCACGTGCTGKVLYDIITGEIREIW